MSEILYGMNSENIDEKTLSTFDLLRTIALYKEYCTKRKEIEKKEERKEERKKDIPQKNQSNKSNNKQEQNNIQYAIKKLNDNDEAQFIQTQNTKIKTRGQPYDTYNKNNIQDNVNQNQDTYTIADHTLEKVISQSLKSYLPKDKTIDTQAKELNNFLSSLGTKYRITISVNNNNNIKLNILDTSTNSYQDIKAGGQSTKNSMNKNAETTIINELSYLIVKEIKDNPEKLDYLVGNK